MWPRQASRIEVTQGLIEEFPMLKQSLTVCAAFAAGAILVATAAQAAPASPGSRSALSTAAPDTAVQHVRQSGRHNFRSRRWNRGPSFRGPSFHGPRFYGFGPRYYGRRCSLERRVWWRHGRRFVHWVRVCHPRRHWL